MAAMGRDANKRPVRLMKTFIAFICTWFAATAMLADPNSAAMKQARKVANSEGKAQQAIEPSTPPPPTPPPQNNPRPDPALEATLRNITGLQRDFATLNSNPTNKQPLINDLTAAAQGSKPSPKSVTKLADDLAAAISGKEKLHTQHRKLAQYIHAIFNSSHLAPAQQQMVFDGVQSILHDGEVSADDTAKVIGDIKAIAAETQ